MHGKRITGFLTCDDRRLCEKHGNLSHQYIEIAVDRFCTNAHILWCRKDIPTEQFRCRSYIWIRKCIRVQKVIDFDDDMKLYSDVYMQIPTSFYLSCFFLQWLKQMQRFLQRVCIWTESEYSTLLEILPLPEERMFGYGIKECLDNISYLDLRYVDRKATSFQNASDLVRALGNVKEVQFDFLSGDIVKRDSITALIDLYGSICSHANIQSVVLTYGQMNLPKSVNGVIINALYKEKPLYSLWCSSWLFGFEAAFVKHDRFLFKFQSHEYECTP